MFVFVFVLIQINGVKRSAKFDINISIRCGVLLKKLKMSDR